MMANEHKDIEFELLASDLSEFETLCAASHLTQASMDKLKDDGITSVALLKLLRTKHLDRVCEDWPLDQAVALEAFLDRLQDQPPARVQPCTASCHADSAVSQPQPPGSGQSLQSPGTSLQMRTALPGTQPYRAQEQYLTGQDDIVLLSSPVGQAAMGRSTPTAAVLVKRAGTAPPTTTTAPSTTTGATTPAGGTSTATTITLITTIWNMPTIETAAATDAYNSNTSSRSAHGAAHHHASTRTAKDSTKLHGGPHCPPSAAPLVQR